MPVGLCLVPRDGVAAGLQTAVRAAFYTIDPGRWSLDWLVMLVAMMPPLLTPIVSHLAARSFVGRRNRTIGLFLAGYGTIWIAMAGLASLLLLAVRGLSAGLGAGALIGPIGCAAAAIWQLSDAKRRALNRCHGKVALRVRGWAADRDALDFGLKHGLRCAQACAPTMFLPMLGSHGLVASVVIFLILLGERTRAAPQQTASAVLLTMLGMVSLATN